MELCRGSALFRGCRTQSSSGVVPPWRGRKGCVIPALARPRRLFGKLFQVSDDVLAILLILQSGEHHFPFVDDRLGVFQVFVEVLFVPDEALRGQRLEVAGIGIGLQAASLAPDDIVERRSDLDLGAFSYVMTDLALLKHVLAVF